MIGSDRGYQTLSRPPLLWQDNWFQTWKWFESFLQLHRPSLFDWAGLQTPPEERGGGLEQWGRVGYLVWHLYTFHRQLVSSKKNVRWQIFVSSIPRVVMLASFSFRLLKLLSIFPTLIVLLNILKYRFIYLTWLDLIIFNQPIELIIFFA